MILQAKKSYKTKNGDVAMIQRVAENCAYAKLRNEFGTFLYELDGTIVGGHEILQKYNIVSEI